jgi:Spy/CpxP family protein refolding chaperone
MMFPRELELDPAQKEIFEQLRQSMREEEAVLDQAMAGVRGTLAEELQNDEPNIDRLRELIARQGDLMQQRRVGAANRFADFLNVLTPEQTRVMARHMLRNMPRPGEGGRDGKGGPGKLPAEIVRRFDADGDGVLNDSERASAQTEFEMHRREWEARRAELRQRFDADANGELDRAETALMRQWLIENRPRDRERGRDRGGPDRDGSNDDGPDHDGRGMTPPPDGQSGPGDEPFVPDWW